MMRAAHVVCEPPIASPGPYRRQMSELVRQEPQGQWVPRQEPGNEEMVAEHRGDEVRELSTPLGRAKMVSC